MPSDRTYAGVALADRVARRRRALTDAGLTLFGTQGYHQVTVRQLCAAAQVSHRGFYQEFANTEDLLVTVYEAGMDRLESAVADAVRDLDGDGDGAVDGELDAVIGAVLDAFFRVLENDQALGRLVWFEVLGVSDRVDDVYLRRIEAFVSLMGALLDDLQVAATVAGEQRVVLLRALVGGVSEVARRWVKDDFAAARGDLVAPLVLLLRAVAAGVVRVPE